MPQLLSKMALQSQGDPASSTPESLGEAEAVVAEWGEVEDKVKDLEAWLKADHNDFGKWVKEQSSKIMGFFKKPGGGHDNQEQQLELPPANELAEATKGKKMETQKINQILQRYIDEAEQRGAARRVGTFLTFVQAVGEPIADGISGVSCILSHMQ